MPDALARAVVAADPLGDRAAGPARAAGEHRPSGALQPTGPDAAAAGLRTAAARAIADVIAASFAVAADPSALADRDRLVAWARAEGTPAEPRTVIGTGTGLAPARAALVGGFQAHLLDLDDTHELVRGHPSAVLVPTLLALAGPEEPVDRALAAHIVGLEVMARLGRALGSAHYQAGWHPTGTAGAVAAAAAGAHLLRLDEERTSTALSVAASRSGGVRAQFGTPGKPLHAGLAAQTGVEAVAWAAAGLRTAEDAVLGPAGLLAAHGVPEAGRRAVLEGFGAPGARWALEDPGLWFKRHPFCSAAMSAADAATEIARRLPHHLGEQAGAGAAVGAGEPSGAIADAGAEAGEHLRAAVGIDVPSSAPASDADRRAAAIAQVVVRMRPGADAALVHTAPRTGEEARFSVEAIVALILLGLEPDLTQLSPRPLPPLVTELVARVRREHVPAPTPGPGGGGPAPAHPVDSHLPYQKRPDDGSPGDCREHPSADAHPSADVPAESAAGAPADPPAGAPGGSPAGPLAGPPAASPSGPPAGAPAAPPSDAAKRQADGSAGPAVPVAAARRDFWAQVEVRLRDGDVLSAQVQRPLGSPERPLPESAVRDKLEETCGDPRRAAAILDVLGLGAGGASAPRTVGRLTELLQDPPAPPPTASPTPPPTTPPAPQPTTSPSTPDGRTHR